MSEQNEAAAQAQTNSVALETITPLGMLQKAVTSGADIGVLERLMDLQERWQKSEAQRAFTAALSRVRTEMPPIIKTQTVDFSTSKGRTAYKYEDLAEIISVISPVLGKHDLSFRWRTDSTNGTAVAVTCIIEHADGHSEETTLSAGIDNTGNKNAVQAIGSVVTYLQRYTLKASLGIAAGVDDDGRQGAASNEPPRREEKPPQPKTESEQPASDGQREKYTVLLDTAEVLGIIDNGALKDSLKWVVEPGVTSDMIEQRIAAWEKAVADAEAKQQESDAAQADSPVPLTEALETIDTLSRSQLLTDEERDGIAEAKKAVETLADAQALIERIDTLINVRRDSNNAQAGTQSTESAPAASSAAERAVERPMDLIAPSHWIYDIDPIAHDADFMKALEVPNTDAMLGFNIGALLLDASKARGLSKTYTTLKMRSIWSAHLEENEGNTDDSAEDLKYYPVVLLPDLLNWIDIEASKAQQKREAEEAQREKQKKTSGNLF